MAAASRRARWSVRTQRLYAIVLRSNRLAKRLVFSGERSSDGGGGVQPAAAAIATRRRIVGGNVLRREQSLEVGCRPRAHSRRDLRSQRLEVRGRRFSISEVCEPPP